MTTIPHPAHHPGPRCVTTPIIDCEPPPLGPGTRPPAGLHRRIPHQRRSVVRADAPAPMPAPAGAFADAALRRILEVIDGRRPAAQLRGLLAPGLIDATVALARTPQPGGSAVLRRVGLRRAGECDPEEPGAAEVYATYTRGPRVRAIAARIQLVSDRWQVVALQVG